MSTNIDSNSMLLCDQRELIMITVQDKGDGSCNFVDYYCPSPAIFSNKEKAAQILYDYIKADDPCHEIFETSRSDCDSDSGSEVENITQMELLDLALKRGGIKVDDDQIVKVETIHLNPDDICSGDMDWDLPKYVKYANDNDVSQSLRRKRKTYEKKALDLVRNKVKFVVRTKEQVEKENTEKAKEKARQDAEFRAKCNTKRR